MHNSIIRTFSAVSLLTLTLVSCSKKETVSTTDSTKSSVTTAGVSLDTNVKAEEVAITDTTHRLFFRPQVGTTQRYHVVDKMTADITDQQPGGQATKHGGYSTTEYYLTQTVKSVNAKDSTVELTVKIDEIRLNAQQDTAKVDYWSTRDADRKNDKYREFNIMLGKPVTIKTNKYGDLADITDVGAIASDLMTNVPDSLKSNPRVKLMANQQAQQIVNSYVVRVLAHSPTRPLVKDTTWKNVSQVNLDVAPGLAFPVSVEATETVRGLEKRGDKVIAVLEDRTKTTPTKTVFQEGPTKATISNFVATAHGLVRIEDATGLLFHRTLDERRDLTFVVESKQQAGQKRTLQQAGSETMTVEQVK